MHTKEEIQATRNFIGEYVQKLIEQHSSFKSTDDTISGITLAVTDGNYQLFPFSKPIPAPLNVHPNTIINYLNDNKLAVMLYQYAQLVNSKSIK